MRASSSALFITGLLTLFLIEPADALSGSPNPQTLDRTSPAQPIPVTATDSDKSESASSENVSLPARSFANDVSVHLNGGTDVVRLNDWNTLEIWISNDDVVEGFTLGFEFSGPVVISWDYSGCNWDHITAEPFLSGNIFDLDQGCNAWTSTPVDTLGIFGNVLFNPGVAPGPSRLWFTGRFFAYSMGPSASIANAICVDNVEYYPTNDWLMGNSGNWWAPDYNGMTGGESAPAVCFDGEVSGSKLFACAFESGFDGFTQFDCCMTRPFLSGYFSSYGLRLSSQLENQAYYSANINLPATFVLEYELQIDNLTGNTDGDIRFQESNGDYYSVELHTPGDSRDVIATMKNGVRTLLAQRNETMDDGVWAHIRIERDSDGWIRVFKDGQSYMSAQNTQITTPGKLWLRSWDNDVTFDNIAMFDNYTCGDADGNGIVTISDAVYLINYIFSGGPAPEPTASGDADCNGIVTISDAVFLINYIFSGGPAPCTSCK